MSDLANDVDTDSLTHHGAGNEHAYHWCAGMEHLRYLRSRAVCWTPATRSTSWSYIASGIGTATQERSHER